MSEQVTPPPSNLRNVTRYITGHDESTGKAVVASATPASWGPFDKGQMGFHQIYTSSFPADLNDGKDIKAHEELIASGKLGLVKPGGVVCRQVDFAPGYECQMHRTSSLDFGIVLEGTIEMVLDDGSRTTMHRGDVAVQRATMHAWKNASEREWARMLFVLQDIQRVQVKGVQLGEDLGNAASDLPPSGNDGPAKI